MHVSAAVVQSWGVIPFPSPTLSICIFASLRLVFLTPSLCRNISTQMPRKTGAFLFHHSHLYDIQTDILGSECHQISRAPTIWVYVVSGVSHRPRETWGIFQMESYRALEFLSLASTCCPLRSETCVEFLPGLRRVT
jgi:hypothetical protein